MRAGIAALLPAAVVFTLTVCSAQQQMDGSRAMSREEPHTLLKNLATQRSAEALQRARAHNPY